MAKPTTPMPGPIASGKSTDLRLPLEVPANPEESTEKSFKQLEKEFIAETKSVFADLGKEVVASKVEQHQLLTKSRQDSGPGSVHEALQAMLDYTKIGMRDLARRVGVPRKRLLGMIAGREDIPAETLAAIYEVIKQKNPRLFSFENTN